MSLIKWEQHDVAGLVRRDRRRTLRQFTPLAVAVGLLAVWTYRSEPVLSGVFGGMFVAWAWSLAWSWRAVGGHWRDFVSAQPKDAEVQVGELCVGWTASYGSRVLRWEGLTVKKVGGAWTLSVQGREAAYLPARCLDAGETETLQKRVREGQ
jgi:hypothetical protein